MGSLDAPARRTSFVISTRLFAQRILKSDSITPLRTGPPVFGIKLAPQTQSAAPKPFGESCSALFPGREVSSVRGRQGWPNLWPGWVDLIVDARHRKGTTCAG